MLGGTFALSTDDDDEATVNIKKNDMTNLRYPDENCLRSLAQ